MVSSWRFGGLSNREIDSLRSCVRAGEARRSIFNHQVQCNLDLVLLDLVIKMVLSCPWPSFRPDADAPDPATRIHWVGSNGIEPTQTQNDRGGLHGDVLIALIVVTIRGDRLDRVMKMIAPMHGRTIERC